VDRAGVTGTSQLCQYTKSQRDSSLNPWRSRLNIRCFPAFGRGVDLGPGGPSITGAITRKRLTDEKRRTVRFDLRN
jgi:hypothetical protein